jgi:phosphatidylglycerophosphatase A
MLKFLSNLVSTVCFIGYIPFAPGTFGSLAAFLFIYYVKPDDFQLFIYVVIGFFLGTLCSHKTEKESGIKDDKKIVIDEFVGYMASLLFLPQSNFYLIAAFVLFRFFDTLKPFPIKLIEGKIKGGLGIMIDDIVAAIPANMILQIINMNYAQ